MEGARAARCAGSSSACWQGQAGQGVLTLRGCRCFHGTAAARPPARPPTTSPSASLSSATPDPCRPWSKGMLRTRNQDTATVSYGLASSLSYVSLIISVLGSTTCPNVQPATTAAHTAGAGSHRTWEARVPPTVPASDATEPSRAIPAAPCPCCLCCAAGAGAWPGRPSSRGEAPLAQRARRSLGGQTQ